MHCTQAFNIAATFGPIIGGQTVRPTLEAIIAAEPGLQLILDQATASRHLRGRARWLAYETLKQAAAGLVGWYSRDLRLGETDHYEVTLAEIARRIDL